MDYNKIILCRNCNCMTKTKEGTIYICGKCKKDRRKKPEVIILDDNELSILSYNKYQLCKKCQDGKHGGKEWKLN